ncbi:MAG: 50S ribosomal protein L6 [Candidatus Aenigmarchaeota archaeon]|nr:50S ribosomal protein L6 [Candidatus Aenigmarchaeota archaeon]
MQTTITAPEGVAVRAENGSVHAKGPKGELSRAFVHPLLTLSVKENTLTITSKDDRKETRALVGTWRAHLNNMFTGVTQGFERKMRIVHVHFPMSVKVEGSKLTVQNLLGQKNLKIAPIEDGVDAKIDGENIVLNGIDVEKVGQTVSNIEVATRLSNRRDRRRFYDGIYAVE